MMTVVLFVASCLFILQGMSVFLIDLLEDTIDVRAEFSETASEDDILKAREELLFLEEVQLVEYITKEEALRRFLERRENDEDIIASLEIIGTNPLLPSLEIQAKNPREFKDIDMYIENSSFMPSVSHLDFQDRSTMIERLMLLATSIRVGVLAVILALAFIAVLVAFNTIRLTIYNSRQEIEVMRLVGASNWFIRGPFLIQGILVGALATAFTFLLLFGMSYFASDAIEHFTRFRIAEFLVENLVLLAVLMLAVSIGLGIVSSTIAIRKHLKV